MRRSRTILLGAFMVAGLLIGPGMGVAAAGPSAGVIAATGWDCSPHGSGTNGVNTTISAALIFQNNVSKSSITCFFPNAASDSAVNASGIDIGGYCYYNVNMGIGVQFRHRIYFVRSNGTATLACWDGYFECMQSAGSTPTVCSTTVAPRSRRNVT